MLIPWRVIGSCSNLSFKFCLGCDVLEVFFFKVSLHEGNSYDLNSEPTWPIDQLPCKGIHLCYALPN